MTRSWYYFDEESKQMREGFPPSKIDHFGDAPYVIGDTINAYRHPSTGVTVESRSALREMDKICGTITTDKRQEPNANFTRYQKEARKRDGKQALEKAVAMVDSGTAPITEEMRASCDRENERIFKTTKLNPYNVAGKKNDRRGKNRR